MKCAILLVILSVICLVNSDHLVIGNVADRVILAKHELVEYNPIPFKKRVKNFFYSAPDYKKITGIQALDNLHSKASINVTAGGIGYSYVNLRMKSERGSGLSYDVGIYVNQDFN